jgi:hypothetical protein
VTAKTFLIGLRLQTARPNSNPEPGEETDATMRPNAEIIRPGAKQTRKNNTVFVIHLRAAPDRDAIHELRGLLKVALRRHGFKALRIREEAIEQGETAA